MSVCGSRARLLAVTALAIATAHPLDAAPDAAKLIAGLAREPPASIAFTEVRFSSLLREPLIVSGDLAYGGPGNLERQVTRPYRETTTIRGESARIEREGEEPRTFTLRHAPELQGFVSAFGSLLAGDAAALEKSFDVAASGDDSAWQLELKPTDSHARRRVRAIVVNGRDDEPRCVATLDAQGGGGVLLLGAVAVAPNTSLDDLLAQCRAE
jgi:hypothetical protein